MIIGISGKKGHGKDTVANILRILATHLGRSSTNEKVAEMVWEIEKGEINADMLFPRFEVHRFADKLKDMVCVLLGCTREQLEDREFKESPIEGWVAYQMMQHGFASDFPSGPLHSTKESAMEYAKSRSHMNWVRETQLTPRLILQLLGTQGMRDVLHPDIHVLATLSEYDKGCGNHAAWTDNMGYQEVDWEPEWIIPDVRFPNEAQAIEDRGGVLIRIEREGMDVSDNHPSETALDDYEGFNHVIHNTGNLEELVGLVRGLINYIDVEAHPMATESND